MEERKRSNNLGVNIQLVSYYTLPILYTRWRIRVVAADLRMIKVIPVPMQGIYFVKLLPQQAICKILPLPQTKTICG
jgi:hypothetical protein